MRKILSFNSDLSGDQMSMVLSRARQIESDSNRDAYFQAVADALRLVNPIDDRAVACAVAAAFAPFNPNLSDKDREWLIEHRGRWGDRP